MGACTFKRMFDSLPIHFILFFQAEDGIRDVAVTGVQTCALPILYHFFFEMLYHNLFGEKKILAQKPKPRLINLILNLTFYGWKNIRGLIHSHFGNTKDKEYLMMVDLLDNSLPLTLDIYTKLFRCGFFEGYLESIVKI